MERGKVDVASAMEPAEVGALHVMERARFVAKIVAEPAESIARNVMDWGNEYVIIRLLKNLIITMTTPQNIITV